MKKLILIISLITTNVQAQSACNIGDFLFYDLTCSSDVNASDHPIAIVLAPVRRVAVSLNQEVHPWGTQGVGLEISTPKGLMRTKEAALEEYSGQELAGVFESIAPNFYPAIMYCASMDWVEGKPWYLPELGLLNQMYERKDAINKALAQIKTAQKLDTHTYWSGSQYSYSQSWQQSLLTGNINYHSNHKKNNIRCVINY